MSLDQSPLATSSGVGSSSWAMLQRRQDTISDGDCDGGYDDSGVHKGLVFTMIVVWSLSSFLISTFVVFLTYELVVKLSVVLLWSGHLQAGKERGLESGGGSGSMMYNLCGRICRSQWFCVRAVAGFFCWVRILMGSTCARRRWAGVS